MPSYTKVAAGNIIPCRFVKLDTTAPGTVLQAGAGTRPYGISHPGTRNIPGDGLGMDDGYLAISGENVAIHGPPAKDVMLQLGGTVDEGDFIMPSTNGLGIVVAANNDIYGAIAMKAGAAGDLIPVQVVAPSYYGA